MGLSALTAGLNCTRLDLVQLLAYCRAIFFQVALKPMWLLSNPKASSSFQLKDQT